jgi:hypothetical protein
MTGLRAALADYLALRRALGYKLAADECLLRQFLGFMKANDAKMITTALALRWATLPSGASPGWLSQRLSAVRGFAVFVAIRDEAVPGAAPASSARRPGPGSPTRGCGRLSLSCAGRPASSRHRRAAGQGCTTSAIRWTAGLCALRACFCLWGWYRWCFGPHNPGGRCYRASESGQPVRDGAGWLAALLGAARIGEESLVCSFRYRMQR